MRADIIVAAAAAAVDATPVIVTAFARTINYEHEHYCILVNVVVVVVVDLLSYDRTRDSRHFCAIDILSLRLKGKWRYVLLLKCHAIVLLSCLVKHPSARRMLSRETLAAFIDGRTSG